MTSVAIVAIPSQDDYVWKLSSEKIPHMTLLFLGEMTPGPELAQIESFLQHVVDSSMHRFGASVDRRGTLGPKNADVLFFYKDYLTDVATARANMLQNPQIKAAYDAIEQYPEWMPHLTMGYPETPAKEDTRDYPINYVQFDKIALWIGDYEGPEFQLNSDEGMALAMSTDEYAGVVLSHHGVKGMKWGVRRDRGHEGESATTKTIAKADKHFENSFSPSIANWVKVQNEFANHINPMLNELNSRPHYGRDLSQDRKLHDRYFKDYEKVVEKAAIATTKSFGTNASGTRQMKVTRHGFGENSTWKAELVDIKHAVNDGVLESFVIVPKFDKTGHIVDQTVHDPAVLPLGSAVAHGEDYAGVTLSHHGVKGMKWGVRRDQNGSGHVSVRQRVGDAKAKAKQELADRSSTDVIVRTKPGQGVRTVGGNKQDAHPDAIAARSAEQKIKRSTLDSVSNKDLQSLVTRMNLEQQYRNLSVHEDRRSAGEKYLMKFMDEKGEKSLSKLGPAAPLITQKVGDVINGNKAFDTGSATNKKK